MSGFTPAPAPCDGGNCCPPPVARINQRVRDGDGFYATVLYVGPVASAKNQKETYVGVEWDDDTRGKHDGSVISRSTNAIVRHFKCESSSPTAGSFVKPSKVRMSVCAAPRYAFLVANNSLTTPFTPPTPTHSSTSALTSLPPYPTATSTPTPPSLRPGTSSTGASP